MLATKLILLAIDVSRFHKYVLLLVTTHKINDICKFSVSQPNLQGSGFIKTMDYRGKFLYYYFLKTIVNIVPKI